MRYILMAGSVLVFDYAEIFFYYMLRVEVCILKFYLHFPIIFYGVDLGNQFRLLLPKLEESA